jgi:hypothetical protein
MVKQRYEPGPPMTLANMHELGVHRLLISCVNPQCRREALLDVSGYRADTTVPSFVPRMRCSAIAGARGVFLSRRARDPSCVSRSVHKPGSCGLTVRDLGRR